MMMMMTQLNFPTIMENKTATVKPWLMMMMMMIDVLRPLLYTW